MDPHIVCGKRMLAAYFAIGLFTIQNFSIFCIARTARFGIAKLNGLLFAIPCFSSLNDTTKGIDMLKAVIGRPFCKSRQLQFFLGHAHLGW